MKKKFLSILLLIGFFNYPETTFAQEANSILRESNETFSRVQDFSADFVYSIENPSNVNTIVSKKGILIFSKGKYIVKMPDQEIYSDGKTLWIHLPQDEELTILNYDPEEGLELEQIFTFSKGQEEKARYESQEVVEGRPLDQIYLSINNPDLDFNLARIWINSDSKLMEKIIMINRMQTRTSYEFSNILINQGLTESTFVFDLNNFKGDIYDER
jgi:outer membrane lipoprotein-sorting protein